ncbi:ketopantoate reductase family protein [Anaerotruncus rubiinfantis]|jgi:2-dehydropantoate 2-reductase|uniref:ketopantoate reductase family protein n=1 Tax=Anaerotruncus rubiinfantis TaxID=1720200 RepID=UPI001897A497|nr:2-dehydropantoate 2-reductase [Anaerotruncus rubiinfantis]
MNYLIIGSGATGGCIGGYLAAAGKDVTFIARGAHLAAMKEHGFLLHGTRMGEVKIDPVQACTAEDYTGKADVIFLCVKGYALEGVLPLMSKAAKPDSIIVPMLNIVGTGGALQERFPEYTILDGCIYIGSYINAPGEVTQTGDTFRVVYGEREGSAHAAQLAAIADDLREARIDPVVSEDIRSAAFAKYCMVSPYAAVEAYYDILTEPLQKPGRERDLYVALTKEAIAVGRAMGLTLADQIVDDNLMQVDESTPDSSASMYKDLKRGGESEIDGLLFQVVRLARQYGVSVPNYLMIAEKYGYQG